MASIPLSEATSNVASYLPAGVPAWLASSQADQGVLWLGYVILACSAGMIGGQFSARRHSIEARIHRRLTHDQKRKISETFKNHISPQPPLYIVSYKNDECIDFAHDLSSAFHMAGATTSLEEFIRIPSRPIKDVEILPYPGAVAHAETLVSLLSDFGFKSRVGHIIEGHQGQLFRILVNRPN